MDKLAAIGVIVVILMVIGSCSNSSSSYDYNSNNYNSNSGYGYDKNDPYYSANDHNNDGKLTDEEFHDALDDFIDDYSAYGN